MSFKGHEFIHQVRDFSTSMVEYAGQHLDIVDGTPRGLNLETADEVMGFVREHGITSIRLWFTSGPRTSSPMRIASFT